MTTFTQFGPDDPLSSLNIEFQKCLPPYDTPLSPSEQKRCDQVVGSMASGNGYCSVDRYSRMTYCSCVNNAIPCPMDAAASCANSAFAYRPSNMIAPNGQAFKACKDATICVNIVEVGGSQNVVTGISQECGAIQNVRNIINSNPILAGIALILIIILVFLVLSRSSDDVLPPMPPGLFA